MKDLTSNEVVLEIRKRLYSELTLKQQLAVQASFCFMKDVFSGKHGEEIKKIAIDQLGTNVEDFYKTLIV